MLAYENALLDTIMMIMMLPRKPPESSLQVLIAYVVTIAPLRIGEGFPLGESLPQRSVGVGDYYGV